MSFQNDYSKYLQTNDLYKLLIDETPLAVVVISRDGTILHMNKTMLKFTGYTYNEVISREYLRLFVPREDWNLCLPMFKKHSNDSTIGERVFNVNRVIAKGGKQYMLEWHGRNIADEHSEVVFSLGCGIDITERQEYALELKKAFHEIEILKNKLERENTALKRQIKSTTLRKIVGTSDAVKDVLQRVTLLANTDTTVLILGETGTGKELIAEALHNASNRSSKALIKVNCPAIPETLFESELFGHVQGAFSGAVSHKTGRIHAAEGGTLVLDEIGEIPISTQVKLLRFLESREYERVGESKTSKANVRIIASTNADLNTLVQKGKFRADLLYRLRVATLTLPPLRERKSDIKVLINDFLGYYNHLFNKQVLFPNTEVLEFLQNYEWPGNIRELRHVIEHACIYCPESHIKMEHLPEYLNKTLAEASGQIRETNGKVSKERLLEILNQCKWNKKNAAKELGVHRCTLYRMMEKHAISKQ